MSDFNFIRYILIKNISILSIFQCDIFWNVSYLSISNISQNLRLVIVRFFQLSQFSKWLSESTVSISHCCILVTQCHIHSNRGYWLRLYISKCSIISMSNIYHYQIYYIVRCISMSDIFWYEAYINDG